MFPKPIYWHSGQYLEPQHFQDTDWYNHCARTEILKLCRPFFEGVIRLDVDAAALAEGTLAFTAAELMFIDGSHVFWNGQREDGNASPIARALPDEWGGDIEPEYSQGILIFRLPEDVMASGISFCLSVKSDEPVRTVLAEGRLIAGSPDAVKKAIRLALPELPLSIAPPPRGLPRQDGVTYLVPSVGHEAWKNVMAVRCLALAYYPTRDPGAAQLLAMARLYALRGG